MKRKSSHAHIVLVLFLAITISGCYYDQYEEGLTATAVSYTADIQPLFETYCTACHPGVVATPDLSSGNSYSSITNGIYIVPNDINSSTLYQRLIGNPSIMPPNGSLSASELQLVKSWIEQGAINN
jgi:hypothetical protein